MRGTIVVYDPAHPDAMIPADPPDPVVESVAARRVNVDAPHDAPAVPTVPVSIERGARIIARLGRDLPADVATLAWRRRLSPAQVWRRLVGAGPRSGRGLGRRRQSLSARGRSGKGCHGGDAVREELRRVPRGVR